MLKPVEYMTAQWMACGQDRVVKVVAGIVGHTEFLHHAAGPQVVGNREGDNALEAEFLNAVVDRGARAFGREPFTPIFESKPPTDFDCWREMRIECRNGQTYKPDKGAGLQEFDRKGAEAMPIEVLPGAIEECVGGF